MSSNQSIDFSMIDQIRELQSDEDPHFLANLLNLFLTTIPTRLKKIEDAISTQKADELRAEAHGLKSSSANIGAVKMAELCTELEKLGKTGSVNGAAPLFAQLKSATATVETTLRGLPEMKTTQRKAA